MLVIGANDAAKADVFETYVREHGITKVFVISPDRFAPPFAPQAVTTPDEVDGRRGVYIKWPEHIEYRYYYKVIQQADANTLLVLNEVLRGKHRTMLNFNCIRTFLRHVPHKLIFQYLPVIDELADVMALVDFETGSRWWDRSFEPGMVAELDMKMSFAPIEIVPVRVPVDEKTRAAYAREKTKLLEEVRSDPDKDPHNIPRNLYLVSGKAKQRHVEPGKRYVGRNNRLKVPGLETYRDVVDEGQRVVLELPHSFLDMTDFLTVSRQSRIEVLVADTKVDDWYLRRYQDWAQRVNDAAIALHR